MNKIVIIIMLIICENSFSQIQNFNCEQITKGKLLEKYNQYKKLGFHLVYDDTIDVIEYTIDDASNELIKQMCINAWGEVYKNGADYTYEKFKRRNFQISQYDYNKDIQYLEILSELKNQLINNLDSNKLRIISAERFDENSKFTNGTATNKNFTDDLGFDYEVYQDAKILVPTWNNVFNMISIPQYLFKELMDEYGYFKVEGKEYYWKMSKGENADFFITQSKGKVLFSWKNSKLNNKL